MEAYEEERSPDGRVVNSIYLLARWINHFRNCFRKKSFAFRILDPCKIVGENGEPSGSLVNCLIKDQVGAFIVPAGIIFIHILVIALVAAVFHQLVRF